MKIWSLLVFFLLSLGVVNFSQAHDPKGPISYQYEAISVTIRVNEDSTFDVEERQTFNYVGNYHVGWRSVALQKTDAISDIQVLDGQTGEPFIYSRERLDKLDPKSHGKYTTFRQDRAQNIEWYYDLADTTHSWILRYKIHGGIAFGREAGRLYWNIFTDYDVPVSFASVSITLPKAAPKNEIFLDAYRNNPGSIIKDYESGTFSFSSVNFYPQEGFTVDVSWPKGIVSQSAYWKDFLKIYYGYIGTIASLLLAFGIGFWYWLKREKLAERRGTIIPQYEPPQNLRPAMAEVITKEKLTPKGLTATIIDLAVRGYIKIEEDKKKNIVGIMSLAFVLFITFLLLVLTKTFWGLLVVGAFILLVLLKSARAFGWGQMKDLVVSKEYILRKFKSYDDGDLENYERTYLNILFAGEDHFSTRELKKDHDRARLFYQEMQNLKNEIYKETEIDTRAFETLISKEKYKTITWVMLIVMSFVLFMVFQISFSQFGILVTSLVFSGIGLWAFIKYEARLNLEGRILKEEWLGFKMYLEVADRYRMQNLKPEYFEKYLPYAMIFGVEKQWAKAFDAMHLPAPSWYGGGIYISGGSGSSSIGSFSPSAFSASFSSAFTSAFGSSGAGGGGGGGGAGGGSGGGGGGAG